jgi:hypothetical protein
MASIIWFMTGRYHRRMRAPGGSSLLDVSARRSAQGRWALEALVVALLAACAYLVGIAAVPVTDRDEPRFAQASRQMAESDRLADWVIPRVGDEIRLKKPPLIYWVQAPTVLAITGGDPSRDAIWM